MCDYRNHAARSAARGAGDTARKGRESHRKPPLKMRVPSYELDSRISAAAIVSHEEKLLWASKKNCLMALPPAPETDM